MDRVLDALKEKDKHVVIGIAPSVRTAIGEAFGMDYGTDVTGKLYAALRKLGFTKVFDVNFAADVTILEEGTELIGRIQNGGPFPMFTSCCPGWIRLVENYYPNLLDNLSSAKSPKQIFGAASKTYYPYTEGIDSKDVFTVSVMPCTAKKFEADRDEMWNDDNTNKNITPYEKCIKGCKHTKCMNNKKLEEEKVMRICFPVKSNEGVKSIPYGHFGTAPTFVICDLEKNEITTVGNGDLGHEHGKCQPIKALSGEVVDAVVVGGIGAGAINKLNSMGIKVYKALEGTIEANLEAFKKGELKEFSRTHTCSHDGCNH